MLIPIKIPQGKKCLGYINSQKNNREEKNYFCIFVFTIKNEKESKI